MTLQKFAFPLLLILVSSVYIYTAKDLAILDDGDALYAHVAQQMERTGDWVTPYADGVRFLDKPPLMYWLMGSAYKIFGATEFAARLPSALAVLGTGILLFFAGRKAGGSSTGFIAGMILAFCVGTFLFTRMVFPDMLFVFLLTLSLFCFLAWHSNERNPVLPAMLFYATLAGAVLTKGMIGLFFPIAIIAGFLLWSGDWRRLRHFHPKKGVLLFVALAVPWHILAAWRNPGFLWYFFMNEQVLRFLGRRQPMDYESIPLLIFWALILVWLFPWSAFLPAIGQVLRAPSSPGSQASPLVRLCLTWVLVVLGFFSLSSRIEHYALPLFPPLALLVGMAISPDTHVDAREEYRRGRWVARGFLLLGIVGAVLGLILAGIGLAWLIGKFHGVTTAAMDMTHSRAYKFYFAPLLDFPPPILAQLEGPLLKTVAALSAGMLGAWWLNRRERRMWAVAALSAMMIVFCFCAFRSLELCQDILSSRQFGRKLMELRQPGDCVVVVGDFETANSVNFYVPIPLQVYAGTAALLDWGLRYPDAPNRILTRKDLDSRWNSFSRTFLIVPDDRVAALGMTHACVAMRSAGRTLLCNQPPPAP